MVKHAKSLTYCKLNDRLIKVLHDHIPAQTLYGFERPELGYFGRIRHILLIQNIL